MSWPIRDQEYYLKKYNAFSVHLEEHFWLVGNWACSDNEKVESVENVNRRTDGHLALSYQKAQVILLRPR
jgi:hypothetical protein